MIRFKEFLREYVDTSNIWIGPDNRMHDFRHQTHAEWYRENIEHTRSNGAADAVAHMDWEKAYTTGWLRIVQAVSDIYIMGTRAALRRARDKLMMLIKDKAAYEGCHAIFDVYEGGKGDFTIGKTFDMPQDMPKLRSFLNTA